MQIHPQTKLRKWILKIGTKRLAHRLNLDLSTIYRWLDGSRCPSSGLMRELLRLSKGRISADDILDHSYETTKARVARR